MGFVKLFYARFFDEEGKHLKDVWFRKDKSTFNFKGKSYNVKRDKASYFKKTGIFLNKRYYHYNISNPDPLFLGKTVKPLLDPEMYNIQLENKIAKKLNDVNSNGLLDKIGFKEVLIGAVLLVGGYLLITGGLTP
ncbi:MAG: hypothetical protein ACOC56_02825 [Atribacterota bacterium]